MEFKEITLTDKPILEKYLFSWRNENNDFNFSTLYLWGRHGKIKYAEQDGALYVYYNFPDLPPFFLPPVPQDANADYKKAVETAVAEMRSMHIAPCFRSVSEPFYQPMKNALDHPIIERTPFNEDYVYLTSDLIELKGKKYHSKKNHINAFLKAHSDWEYVTVTSENLDECMALYKQWSVGKEEPTIDEYDERLTVELAIRYMRELGLLGGGIRVGGELKAFSVGERVSPDMLTVHIEKADASVNGLFPLINQQFALHEGRGLTYVNREDDMGIEGLMKAKQSYHPCRMVEKYKFSLPE